MNFLVSFLTVNQRKGGGTKEGKKGSSIIFTWADFNKVKSVHSCQKIRVNMLISQSTLDTLAKRNHITEIMSSSTKTQMINNYKVCFKRLTITVTKTQVSYIRND